MSGCGGMETFNADSSSGLFVSDVKEEKPDLESKGDCFLNVGI